jgi:hypothetical protein
VVSPVAEIRSNGDRRLEQQRKTIQLAADEFLEDYRATAVPFAALVFSRNIR